ncbi:MAG: TIGR01244 family sulfur transferase [Gammaproteobacteria bacterium]|nr:TIGR01244 family sulfur transferase [Gammaproteobacteria bacterium]
MTIYRLSETCAVASQIQPDEVAALAADGFTAIICNRPDGEDFGQPTAAAIAAECEKHDIAFHSIPIDRSGLTMDMVKSFQDAVASSAGAVLAYCRSGQRSSVLWQASGSP